MTPEELDSIAAHMTLTLDSPESVKRQGRAIILAQKKLRVLRKQVNAEIRGINQSAAQIRPDSTISILSDIIGKRRLAGKVRQSTRKSIQEQKQKIRQPYIEVKQYIDDLLIEGDRLKLLAQEYLQDPKGVLERIQQEQLEREREAARQNTLDYKLTEILSNLVGGEEKWWVKHWRFPVILQLTLFLLGLLAGNRILTALLCLVTIIVLLPRVAEAVSEKILEKVGNPFFSPLLIRLAIVSLFLVRFFYLMSTG